MRILIALLMALYAEQGIGAETSYFPIQKHEAGVGVSRFGAKWYSDNLRRMGEPRLMPLAKDVKREIYRLTIIPSWGNAITVRVEKSSGIYTLFSRRLDGEDANAPGKLVERYEGPLTIEDSNSLNRSLAAIKCFEMSSQDDVAGNDGEEWILEGVSSGKYHVIRRWCASNEDTTKRGLEAFVALCKFLIDKSHLSERPKDLGRELLPR